MSLEQSTIVKNTQKYFKTATDKGFMNDELMAFLGESFIKAPASTNTDMNNAFEGGLVAHLLLTTSYAVSTNNSLPEAKRVDTDSLIKVCLLHQIGKTFLFVPQTSSWHNERGIMYTFNNDQVSMRVGERSLYIATKFGIKFTEEEYAAINSFDKVDDKMAEYHNTRLGEILKVSNKLAIIDEQGK